MGTALIMLETLFGAKLDGVVETASMPLLRGLATRPTTSIDDDMKEFMEMIRDYPEFKALSDKHEAFLHEWRGLEDMVENWRAQDRMAVRTRFWDLIDAFWKEQGNVALRS